MSEESMVEKVARALAKKDDTHRHWRDLDASSQIIYKGLARVAIEAMHGPTDAMVDAACAARIKLYPAFEGEKPQPTAGDVAQTIYSAMIDAALKEPA